MQRITREEILAALRVDGIANVGEVAAVVLGTDGSISIIKDAGALDDTSTLATLERLSP